MKDINLVLLGATFLITIFNFCVTLSLRRRVKRAERDQALRGFTAQHKATIKPWLPCRDGAAPADARLQ